MAPCLLSQPVWQYQIPHQEKNMFRKILSLSLASILIQLACAYPAFANADPKKEAARIEKVRAAIIKLGTGPEARVKIELEDNTKLEGYIREAGADNFTLMVTRTGSANTVAYSQVKQAKGNNLSTGARIGIGVGVAVGVALVIAYAIFAAHER